MSDGRDDDPRGVQSRKIDSAVDVMNEGNVVHRLKCRRCDGGVCVGIG
jgi:hypothetical protein